MSGPDGNPTFAELMAGINGDGPAGTRQLKQLSDGSWVQWDTKSGEFYTLGGQPINPEAMGFAQPAKAAPGAPDQQYDAQGRAFQWDGRQWTPAPQFDNPTKAAGYRAPSTAQPTPPTQRVDRNGDVVGYNPFTGQEQYRIPGAEYPTLSPQEQQAIKQGDLEATRRFTSEQNQLERDARATESAVSRQQSAQENDYTRQFNAAQAERQNAFNAGESSLSRAQRASEFASTFGLQQQRQKLDAAQQAAQLISMTDPAALPAFLKAGGGNVSNAIASGANALSDNALLPAARTYRAIDEQARPTAFPQPQLATPGPQGGRLGYAGTPYENPNRAFGTAQTVAGNGATFDYRAGSQTPQQVTKATSPTAMTTGTPGQGATWDPNGTGGIQRFAFGSGAPKRDSGQRPRNPLRPNESASFDDNRVDVAGVQDRRGQRPPLMQGFEADGYEDGSHGGAYFDDRWWSPPRHAFGTPGQPATGQFIAGDSTDPTNPAAGGARPELVNLHDPPGPNNATADVQPLTDPASGPGDPPGGPYGPDPTPGGGGVDRVAALLTAIAALLGGAGPSATVAEGGDAPSSAPPLPAPRFAYGTIGFETLAQPEDAPYLEQVRQQRQNVEIPQLFAGQQGDSSYNAGFFTQPSALRSLFTSARQSRYGIDQQTQMEEAQRYRLQGANARGMRFGL